MENLKNNSYSAVYSLVQENLIRKEFLRDKDQCYLEHAGATLYSETQISNIMQDLLTNTYGNPHARNTSSKLTEDAIDQIRYEILRHFNTTPEEYSVVLTSGATAALKLIGETFQYANESEQNGTFVYLEDNHTSVLGMREYAKHSESLSPENAFKIFSHNGFQAHNADSKSANSLFVYPAQCNFSGAKYPLTWIEKVKNGNLNQFSKINGSKNWYVMLDTASFVSTNFLDLSKYTPDFMCVSFYKIFGYPTGLGALLVRNSSAHVLKKNYFGGGTVLMALSSERVYVPRKTFHEFFEDGTLSFLSIMSLRHGFDTLKRFSLNMSDISRHTFALAQYVYRSLWMLHHGNGNPVTILYHDTNFDDIKYQGGIVNFNLLRSTGEYVGYSEVLHISNLYGIHLRTGCFCNPGACRRHLNLTSEDVKYHFKSGHVCGDQNDLIDGYPTGSVRISFGYMSTKRDCDIFLNMIEECFVTKPIIKTSPTSCGSKRKNKIKFTSFERESSASKMLNITSSVLKENLHTDNSIIGSNRSHCLGTLKQMMIYPVKSCGAFEVESKWELASTGLKYDRQWMIVNETGTCLTQKQMPRLCLVKPRLDLKNDLLYLYYKDLSTVSISLKENHNTTLSWLDKCQSKVCGDRIQGWDCGNEVGNWLSEVLEVPNLRLLRQCNNDNEANRTSKHRRDHQLSLTNEAQFLLINISSVQWLMNCLPKNDFSETLQGLINRFRPNFVVDSENSFDENLCSQIQIGNLLFKVDRLCTRCQMICINQSNGEKSVEPLRTLSQEFNGKIKFGIYLSKVPTDKPNKILMLGQNVIGIKNSVPLLL